ncbi:MAG: hypothetical protein M3N95_12170 [Actinomycetota bacterium]|nr:hypothetical protein [Actinomycetota bacterium]
MTEHLDEPTSPLAEETLRLMSSVQDWARRAFGQDSEHPPSDCLWCPLCQFAAALRGERPEVTARVSEAGSAVVSALRALLAAAAGAANNPGQHGHSTAPARPRVQRINLSDEA